VLGFARLERTTSSGEPRRVASIMIDESPASPTNGHAPAEGGQAEAAASLGISRRQVERLLAEARERAGASTTSHLVAMLVNAGLTP